MRSEIEITKIVEKSPIQKAADAYTASINTWTKALERRKAAEVETECATKALYSAITAMNEARAKLDVLVKS